MFAFAILIGIYSYCIFFLGVAGLLYLKFVLPLTVISVLASIFLLKRKFQFINELSRLSIFSMFFLILLSGQIIVNLVGALGPELAFDALWYHLTFPKLYLAYHKIIHFPGGLLTYSTMPKLTEMLYTVPLLFGNEIVAKCIHFSFGLLVCTALYKLSRKFIDQKWALAAVVVFYSNLVVGWMSITAFIDLARTFYELLAFWAFYLFVEKKQKKYFYISAVFMGLAVSTKLIGFGSLIIYFFLIIYIFGIRTNFRQTIQYILQFILVSFIIPLPWFIFSYIHTGNPVYPIFSGLVPSVNLLHLLNPGNFIRDNFKILVMAEDPISPIYFIVLPLIVIFINRFKKNEKILLFYSFFAFIVWYIIPRTGGGRFILPYLPIFSLVTVVTIKKMREKSIIDFSIFLIIFLSIVSIGYRGLANKKYIPVIIGRQSKTDFLSRDLNFSFGDFYDIDGYFAKTIRSNDLVLIYGIHNLYYVNFPFIHESYAKPYDWFNYILVGNDSVLPQRYSNWRLIYQNTTSKVRLYTLPL